MKASLNVFLRALTVLLCLTLIITVGCGPTEHELDFEKSMATCKKDFQVSDIRLAVLPLFEKYNFDGPDQGEILPRDIPKIILSLPVFQGASAKYIRAFAVETNALLFMVGTGFGHQGIIICRDNNAKGVSSVDASRTILWNHGVFFYRE